jgi:cytosine/adenosine deaminase-related metal-dependent hydrolase
MPSRQILHARYVFPVRGEPIENGFVGIEDGRIADVGKTPPRGERIDLGNVAILPGFINAHTHLEFSGLSQPLGTPGMGFVDWISKVIEWREGHRLDPVMTIAMGLQECGKEGVTSVGNISQLEPKNAYENFAVDGIGFVEIISPNRDIISPTVDFSSKQFNAEKIELISSKRDLLTQIVNFNPKNSIAHNDEETASWVFGLSPHAPYSVHSDVLEMLVGVSSLLKFPLAMHLAESREEMQLLREGTGPFRDFLEERNLFDPANFPGGKRPLDYLKLLAAASRALIVHGNYLDDAEIAFLAQRAASMAVVYCPRTHAFFRHDSYPLEKMLAAGATVALGTDSRASSPDLSMLAEMRFAARQHPRIGRERILQMGTIDAARALGRVEEIGSLEAGKAANFAVVKLPAENSDYPYRLLLESEEPVVQTWFHGRSVAVSAPT